MKSGLMLLAVGFVPWIYLAMMMKEHPLAKAAAALPLSHQ